MAGPAAVGPQTTRPAVPVAPTNRHDPKAGATPCRIIASGAWGYHARPFVLADSYRLRFNGLRLSACADCERRSNKYDRAFERASSCLHGAAAKSKRNWRNRNLVL